jgi:hypothetical protein
MTRVSVFRPSARVTGPDGRDWELYAYRMKLPDRRRRRLLWRLADVPRAALAVRGSDEWTIEAITWHPHRTVYTWTTTGEFRGHVLAQVEGQLARGEVPTPRNATYLGASR